MFKMTIETPLHVRDENSCSGLDWLGLKAANLHLYLVECIAILRMCSTLVVGFGNQDENPCIVSLRSDMTMAMRERLFLLEGVVA